MQLQYSLFLDCFQCSNNLGIIKYIYSILLTSNIIQCEVDTVPSQTPSVCHYCAATKRTELHHVRDTALQLERGDLEEGEGKRGGAGCQNPPATPPTPHPLPSGPYPAARTDGRRRNAPLKHEWSDAPEVRGWRFFFFFFYEWGWGR